MKKGIVSALIFCLPLCVMGQVNDSEIKRNTVYIEAFGQGLYNSLSFDRLGNIDKKVKTSFSAGITLIPSSELSVFAIPVSYNYLFGQGNHHLELGLGFTPMYLKSSGIHASIGYTDANGVAQYDEFIGYTNEFYSFFTPKVGYRYQKPDGGIFFRATFTPPVAGFNRIGSIQGGKVIVEMEPYNEIFSSAAFFGRKVFPWAGLSIGWTIK